jgi:hypothetical protein
MFLCKDPATWPTPAADLSVEDAQYGRVRVRTWGGLHAKSQNHPARGSHRTRPVVRGTVVLVVLVEVQRLPTKTRELQQLWLWWRGPGTPDLDLLWRAYVRRCDLEHTLRFGKQLPRFGPKRARNHFPPVGG